MIIYIYRMIYRHRSGANGSCFNLSIADSDGPPCKSIADGKLAFNENGLCLFRPEKSVPQNWFSFLNRIV